VRLTPRGRRDAIEGWSLGTDGTQYLKVRVSVAPQNGEANTALIALLSKTLGIAGFRIRIVGGEAARLKTIQISPAPAPVAARLEAMENVQ